MTVLWLDDEINELRAYIRALQEHTFIECRTIPEAKDAWTSRKDIALVIVDLGPSSSDSLEFIKQIKRVRPRFPIVILSAYLDDTELDSVEGFRFIKMLDKGKVRPTVLNQIMKQLRDESR